MINWLYYCDPLIWGGRAVESKLMENQIAFWLESSRLVSLLRKLLSCHVPPKLFCLNDTQEKETKLFQEKRIKGQGVVWFIEKNDRKFLEKLSRFLSESNPTAQTRLEIMHTTKFITHLPGIWTLNKRVKWRWFEIVRTSSHFPFFMCLVCFNSDKSFLPSSSRTTTLNMLRITIWGDDEALLNKIYAKYKHLLNIFPYSARYLYMPQMRHLPTRERKLDEEKKKTFHLSAVLHYRRAFLVQTASFHLFLLLPYSCLRFLYSWW